MNVGFLFKRTEFTGRIAAKLLYLNVNPYGDFMSR